MEPNKPKQPVALTIAGFDPSGGAGVLADVRTFASLGLRATAAITSVTFQNEARFFGAVHQTAETIRAQVTSIVETAAIACAKTGMLPNSAAVIEVARLFRVLELPKPVVDPVLVSSSSQLLMETDAIPALIKELFPLSRLVTPNIPEVESLTGIKVSSEKDMQEAAAAIRAMGARAVLIKGGHLEHSTSEWAVDLLDDEGEVTVFREQRVSGVELHGSGCVLSAAITAGLGLGMNLNAAVAAAKKFVLQIFSDRGSRSSDC